MFLIWYFSNDEKLVVKLFFFKTKKSFRCEKKKRCFSSYCSLAFQHLKVNFLSFCSCSTSNEDFQMYFKDGRKKENRSLFSNVLLFIKFLCHMIFLSVSIKVPSAKITSRFALHRDKTEVKEYRQQVGSNTKLYEIEVKEGKNLHSRKQEKLNVIKLFFCCFRFYNKKTVWDTRGYYGILSLERRV